LLAEPGENVAADGVIVNVPATFGMLDVGEWLFPDQSYVALEIASEPTSEPDVTVTDGVGSVPFTTFDLFAARTVIARVPTVNVAVSVSEFQLRFPEWVTSIEHGPAPTIVTCPEELTVQTPVVVDTYPVNDPTDDVSSAVTFVVAPSANGASP
jgi:hypothetical protein